MNRSIDDVLNILRIKKQRLIAHSKILLTRIKLNVFIKFNLKSICSITFEIRNSIGIGAKLIWVLEILAYCDERGVVPNFKFSYLDSQRNDDFFNNFFFIKNFKKRKFNSTITLKSIDELGFKKSYNTVLNLDFADILIQKYLSVRSDVVEEVNNFCASNLQFKNILGVHYRGTDKVTEAPQVPYDKVLENIKLYIVNNPETEAVFLSTDDRNFEYFLKQNFKLKKLILREDYYRSQDNSSIHNNKNLCKFRINEDAILNCLILSKCQGLIKCSSILTDWSVLFNPKINLIMLNSPYEDYLWFPTKQLLQRVNNAVV